MRFRLPVSCVLLLLVSCHSANKTNVEENVQAVTPVTVTPVTIGNLTDTIELNATSSFLLKTNVKATTNGYLQEVAIKLGDKVTKGQMVFQIRSKEANTLGNMINKVDTTFRFKGITTIKAPGNGFITQLAYQAGDYVQDGESLATISDMNSLVFLLDLPFELTSFLPNNKHVRLTLPDGRQIQGTVSSPLPFVDPASQTQGYIIRMVNGELSLPENLVAKVNFIQKTKTKAVSLPKEAVLTNEQQTEFWIMKMTDSTTAVKVPIVKGMETSGRIEIVSPVLHEGDKVLLTGNYGLPDTAKVMIETKE
jgi:multidrug efflux pump subunit AcrA (membrane-fusion protein)